MAANEGIFAATHFKRKRLAMASSTKVRSGRAARDFAERDVMMQCVLMLSLLLCLGGVGCSVVPPDRDSDSFAVILSLRVRLKASLTIIPIQMRRFADIRIMS